ncbi:MAG: hypothetical protein OEQ53_01065, partial [Saprospiraceae bacterium]|nr:hypothetical protein [Saprospiraceae bacterium]
MKISVEKDYDLTPLRYARGEDAFFRALQQRVDRYFRSNHLTRYATAGMVGKSMFQLFLWMALYGLIMSNQFQGWSLILLQIGF